MPSRFLFSLLCVAAIAPAGAQSFSHSGSATLGVRAVVANLCSAGALAPGGAPDAFGKVDFGSYSSLSHGVKTTSGAGASGIRVQCAAGVPYRVVLGAGQNDAGSQRQLKGPTGALVRYALYSDAAMSVPWTAVAPVARSGTGTEETIPVYAAIDRQSTPVNGVYSDTVKVTIQW